MFRKEFYYRWQWHLQSPPELLWPLVADTNRFNRDTGLPPLPGDTSARVNARRTLRFRRLGILVEWEEEPFEWVRPFRFGVIRRYRRGPVAEMRVLCQLQPRADSGTTVIYEVWARPKDLLGWVAIPAQIGVLSASSFRKVFHEYDRQAAQAESARPMAPARFGSSLSRSERLRLTQLQNTLLAQGVDADMVARLGDFIENADELELARIRPYRLADAWGRARREVLELCLLATRLGLLEFQWDLLCPLCRGAKHTTQSLGGVRTVVHCDTCNIDFEANFEQSVELTFRPNPAIKSVGAINYCVAGPQVTPHVVVQQLLPPGATRTVQPLLATGRYRLRALNLRGGQYFRVGGYGRAELSLSAEVAGWPDEETMIAPELTLHLANHTPEEQLLIFEHLAWSDEAATAADVTALQRFRDLFAAEALRPGEQISVGSLAVVFTDLRGSTTLYNAVGDAPAFGLVMEHFDVLRQAIEDESGAIVKTIGDAVMAVFRRPLAALQAMVTAQHELATGSERRRPLILKVGIHYGPCIAVSLNERLDYFGSNVNIAARLENQSSGDDIIISNTIFTDPEVADWLSEPDCAIVAEPFKTTLKGYGEEQFVLWRMRRRSQNSRPTPLVPGSANRL